jgi:cob(I)alamin adenosyltransferase
MANRLTRIVTRTGDDGATGLGVVLAARSINAAVGAAEPMSKPGREGSSK